MSRTADQLRTELGAPDITAVEVWRASAKPSPSPSIGGARVGETPARLPRYGARYGATDLLIEAGEYDELLRAGAREGDAAQVRS